MNEGTTFFFFFQGEPQSIHFRKKKVVNSVSNKLEVTVPCTNTKQQQQNRQLHKIKTKKVSHEFLIH